jgi:hypothetical protein
MTKKLDARQWRQVATAVGSRVQDLLRNEMLKHQTVLAQYDAEQRAKMAMTEQLTTRLAHEMANEFWGPEIRRVYNVLHGRA